MQIVAHFKNSQKANIQNYLQLAKELSINAKELVLNGKFRKFNVLMLLTFQNLGMLSLDIELYVTLLPYICENLKKMTG